VHALPDRLEEHRDQGGRQHGEPDRWLALPDQRADTDDDADVQRGDEQAERPDHQCTADQYVDVVELVPGDRDADGDGDQPE
jgi:hypothetical protein